MMNLTRQIYAQIFCAGRHMNRIFISTWCWFNAFYSICETEADLTLEVHWSCGAGFWYHPSPGPVTRHSFTKVANSGAKLFNHPPLPHLSFSASQSTSSPRRPFSIKPWQFTFLADVKAAQECEMWYKWNIRKKRLHNETLRNPRNYWSPALLISIVQTFW